MSYQGDITHPRRAASTIGPQPFPEQDPTMTTSSPSHPSSETAMKPRSGWPILVRVLALPPAFIAAVVIMDIPGEAAGALAVPLGLAWLISLAGFYVVNPNMSRVMVFFGKYRGTVKAPGFWWTNPFTVKNKLSLRAHNVSSDHIKVNDSVGNPIEIGAVVVWRVHDTAQASFDVENYTEYVDIQIEAALRALASAHPYDEPDGAEGVVSLRGDRDDVTAELQRALSERLERAGVEVVEARLSHLAYAPEIASVMLQRQQAQAIIAARRQIVEGAVGMVDEALGMLKDGNVVELDDERKATLVGNLLVVLCGQESAQPILNTGSLYT